MAAYAWGGPAYASSCLSGWYSTDPNSALSQAAIADALRQLEVSSQEVSACMLHRRAMHATLAMLPCPVCRHTRHCSCHCITVLIPSYTAPSWYITSPGMLGTPLSRSMRCHAALDRARNPSCCIGSMPSLHCLHWVNTCTFSAMSHAPQCPPQDSAPSAGQGPVHWACWPQDSAPSAALPSSCTTTPSYSKFINPTLKCRSHSQSTPP